MREFALVAEAAEARRGERLADLLVLGHDGREELRALTQLVRAVRNARAEYKVDPGKKVAAVLAASDPLLAGYLATEADAIAMLARVNPEALATVVKELRRESAELQAAEAAAAQPSAAGRT